MGWRYPRRLIYQQSERWSGWFCERCCWNVPSADSQDVNRRFAEHDCEAFASATWEKPPGQQT